MEGFGSIVVSIQYPVLREEVGCGCHVEGQSEVPPGAAIIRNLHQMKTTTDHSTFMLLLLESILDFLTRHRS